MISKLFEGAGRAKGWTVERMLAASMKYMGKTPAGWTGVLVVAKSRGDSEDLRLCAGDLSAAAAELGLAPSGAVVNEAFPARLAAGIIARGVPTAAAVIPAQWTGTDGQALIHLVVAGGVARAMLFGVKGCSWVVGLEAEGSAEEMLNNAMSEVLGVDIPGLLASAAEADRRSLASAKTRTRPPAEARMSGSDEAVDFVGLMDGCGQRALAGDPSLDPLSFLDELAGLRIAALKALARIDPHVVDARFGAVKAAATKRLASLTKSEGDLWVGAQGLLREFLGNVEVAVRQRDEAATLDGLLQVWLWARMAQDESLVSVVEFSAACRRFEARTLVVADSWLERGPKPYEVLRGDLRAAGRTVKWPRTRAVQLLLRSVVGVVSGALLEGRESAVIDGAAYAVVFISSLLSVIGLGAESDLWKRGAVERNISQEMWAVTLSHNPAAVSRVVAALEEICVQLERSPAEPDLVVAYEAYGRLLSIIGAVVWLYDADDAFQASRDAGVRMLNLMLPAGRTSAPRAVPMASLDGPLGAS